MKRPDKTLPPNFALCADHIEEALNSLRYSAELYAGDTWVWTHRIAIKASKENGNPDGIEAPLQGFDIPGHGDAVRFLEMARDSLEVLAFFGNSRTTRELSEIMDKAIDSLGPVASILLFPDEGAIEELRHEYVENVASWLGEYGPRLNAGRISLNRLHRKTVRSDSYLTLRTGARIELRQSILLFLLENGHDSASNTTDIEPILSGLTEREFSPDERQTQRTLLSLRKDNVVLETGNVPRYRYYLTPYGKRVALALVQSMS